MTTITSPIESAIAEPGNDRRERGRQVDAKDAFRSADVQHRGRVARLRRNGANALHRVDQDREAHAECDHRDPHAVSEAEREDEGGTIAMGGVALASSSNGSSARLRAGEVPMTSPIAIPIAAPIAKPAASRFRLAATSVRKSRVGQISHACSSTSDARGTRNESSAPAQSSQTTKRAGEHGQPE